MLFSLIAPKYLIHDNIFAYPRSPKRARNTVYLTETYSPDLSCLLARRQKDHMTLLSCT